MLAKRLVTIGGRHQCSYMRAMTFLGPNVAPNKHAAGWWFEAEREHTSAACLAAD